MPVPESETERTAGPCGASMVSVGRAMYCERHGIAYQLFKPKPVERRGISCADNFAVNRRDPWKTRVNALVLGTHIPEAVVMGPAFAGTTACEVINWIRLETLSGIGKGR